MSGTVVYGIEGSPFVWSVLMALEEKGAPYEFARMGFTDPKTPAHLERHPFGRVPAFEHDGFKLYETQAILRYIDATIPGAPLRVTDPKDAARMDQLVGISDWYMFRQVTATISFQRIIAPMLGRQTDEAAVAAAVPDATVCVGEIARLAGSNPFLVGDQLTIADLMIAPQIVYLSMTPEGRDILGPHAGLSAWLARMTERPSLRKTTPAPPAL